MQSFGQKDCIIEDLLAYHTPDNMVQDSFLARQEDLKVTRRRPYQIIERLKGGALIEDLELKLYG